MGNCLDCLRRSLRRSRGHSSVEDRSLEDGDRKLVEKELAAVVLRSEVTPSGRSPLFDEAPTRNSKQQDQVGVARAQCTSCRPPSLENNESAIGYSQKATVVRRLFHSPQKPHLDRPLGPGSPQKHKLGHSEKEESGSKQRRATVDVNTANYLQLSVVGFTKDQANAIINHRILNGRFNNLTDVKAVPGISEETWLKLKSRLTLVPSSALIHTRTRPDNFSTFIRTAEHPFDEGLHARSTNVTPLDTSDNGDVQIEKEAKSSSKVDLNHANVHQLICVGFSVSQAHDVVNYRVTKQGYDSVDEIKQIPSISEAAFAGVSQRLTLTPMKYRHSTPRKRTSGRRAHSHSMIPSPFQKPHYSPGKDMFFVFGADDGVKSHDQASPNVESHNHVPMTNDITARSLKTPQASINLSKSPASSSSKRAKSIRVATWNLQNFSTKKVENPGVLEVVCTTIIKHGFDVIVIQEIGSKGEPIQKVCNELNEPTLPVLKSLGSSKKKWKYSVSSNYTGRMFEGVEYNAFLWNAQSGLYLQESYLMDNFSDFIVRKPFIGNFVINDWAFSLVSLHLRAEGWGKKHTKELQTEVSHLPMLITSMEGLTKDVILLGDFNIEPSDPSFDGLRSYGYVNMFNSDEPTNISAANPEGSMCYDNIWISENLMNQRCKGTNRNIVRRNLQHHLIFDSKNPGKPGTVSDHCPVWVAFSLTF